MNFGNFMVCNSCLCWQVSPTYAREIAGNAAVAPHLQKFHGILNGIDPDIWDPYNDKFIPVSQHLRLADSSQTDVLRFKPLHPFVSYICFIWLDSWYYISECSFLTSTFCFPCNDLLIMYEIFLSVYSTQS